MFSLLSTILVSSYTSFITQLFIFFQILSVSYVTQIFFSTMLPETSLQLTIKCRKQTKRTFFRTLKKQYDIPSKRLAELLNQIEAEMYNQLDTLAYKNCFR